MLGIYLPALKVFTIFNLLITRHMKKSYTKKLFYFIFLSSVMGFAQEVGDTMGGEFVANPSNTSCLTAADYTSYFEQIDINKAALNAAGTLLPITEGSSVLFDWPVAQAAGFDYNSVWSISSYADHDPASGSIEDYNCGTRTYDSGSYDHQGIDIYIWPFWWKQMDDEQAHVIAAADGQIIFKNDGSFDRNCSFNSDPWNAVYVLHDDGSIAWYGHMKNGSLTTKVVGDMVSIGEYLGAIGSSGNSTGPHLHFEVYDASSSLIDPYAGACNDWNATSWWTAQKPYINPQINAVLTHDAPIVFNPCPTTETANIKTEFEPNSTIFFGKYLKDQQPGTSAVNTVLDPSGSIYSNWTQNFTTFYYSSWWLNSITINDFEGVWTWRVAYNGETVETEFLVSTLGVNDNDVLGLRLFPNPTLDNLHVASAVAVKSYAVYDFNGKQILTAPLSGTLQNIDVSILSAGVYFIELKGAEGRQTQIERFVKR